MKKMLTVLAAVAFLATAAFAQEEGASGASKGGMPMVFGAELGMGITFADGLDDADFGDRVGFPLINLRALFLLQNVQVGANPLAVGAHIGYNRFYSYEYSQPGFSYMGMTVGGGSVESTISAIPILALAQIRPIAEPLYVEAGLGLAMLSWSTEVNGTENSDSEMDFGLLLGAGYAVALNEQMEIPVGARFMVVFDEGSAKQLQITVGFNYKM